MSVAGASVPRLLLRSPSLPEALPSPEPRLLQSIVSELVILKAGIASSQYVAVGLLGLFIVVAFCAVMFHVNRMAFGMASQERPVLATPPSCKPTLALAAIPLVVIGIYVPAPLQTLLGAAARAMGG